MSSKEMDAIDALVKAQEAELNALENFDVDANEIIADDDPELLAELKAMWDDGSDDGLDGGEEYMMEDEGVSVDEAPVPVDGEQQHTMNTTAESTPGQPTTQPQQQAAPEPGQIVNQPQQTESPPVRDKEEVLAELREKLHQAKMTALNFKRAGKTNEAIRVMHQVKQYKQMVEAIESGSSGVDAVARDTISQLDAMFQSVSDTIESIPQPSEDASPLSDPPEQAVVANDDTAPGAQDNVEKNNEHDSTVNNNNNGNNVSIIRGRIQEYTKAALLLKKSKKSDEAKIMVLQIRKMKVMMESVKNGEPVDLSQLPPPLTADATPTSPKNAGEGTSLKQINLTRQISRAHQVAVQETEKVEKVARVKRQRSMERGEEVDASKKKNELEWEVVDPPHKLSVEDNLGYDTLTRKIDEEIEELSSLAREAFQRAKDASKDEARQYLRHRNEAQKLRELVATARGNEMKCPDFTIQYRVAKREVIFEHIPELMLEVCVVSGEFAKETHAYIVVKFDHDGEQETTTPTRKGRQSLFDHTNMFRLKKNARRENSAKRFKFVKLHFELYHPRTIFSDVLLGTGELKLSGILESSEVLTTVQISSEDRKKIAAISVRLRVRTPLVKRDIRSTSHQHIVITQWHESEVKPQAPPKANLEPPRKHKKQTSAEMEEDVLKPTQAVLATLAGKSESTPVALPVGITEALLEDPHEPSDFVSNDVLDAEIQATTKEANKTKNRNELETLKSRLEDLQLQMRMLEIQVQTGQLTFEVYLQRLGERIARDRELAKLLMQQKRKRDALLVLRRVKIMKAEYDGAANCADELQ